MSRAVVHMAASLRRNYFIVPIMWHQLKRLPRRHKDREFHKEKILRPLRETSIEPHRHKGTEFHKEKT